jgi:4-hydroxy-tetrahydrodipicolinate synthase
MLPEELRRGADGAMTGFSYPEMMVEVCRAHSAGKLDRAADIFDAYLPLARYELQPGLGMAIRKHVLAKRGAIASPALRKPAPLLTPDDTAEIERLLERQARRLKELG